MPIQQVEKYYFQANDEDYPDTLKVEETAIDSCTDDDGASETNEFGHGKGTFFTGYFSITCIIAGTGTLGLPRAFAMGGWLGILILFLSFAMAIYSGTVLIRCLYYKPGHRLPDYKSVGRAAFGWYGYFIASLLHWLNLFGCPALYLVLAAGNMNYMLHETSAGFISTAAWACIIGAVLLIPALVCRTLKEVTLLSALGAICTMVAVFIVVIQAPIDHHHHPEIPVVTDPVIWTGFPSALATIAFSYGGINTYPHVEHALKKPGQWKWVVITGMSTCTALYLMTAVAGYWSFGRDTKSPIYTSLISETPKWISMIVMTIHVILAIPIYTTSFSLEFEKFTNITDERFGKFKAWFLRAIIRTFAMGVLVILAIFIPYFDDFMSLIGALSNCGLVFLLPVCCYLKLTGFRNKPWYELGFCGLTIFLGVIGCIFGTIDAIKALHADFN